ncbi:MAG: DUF4367 domain-containing protein [Anaerolineales bacterium]|nr:DUF4367 domain-containing protein [Anaerolineales bacterium]
MNDQTEPKKQAPNEFVERFSAEVDAILERADVAENRPAHEFFTAIDLARELANLDFSRDSANQAELRRRLLNRPNTARRAAYIRISMQNWRGGLVAALLLLLMLGIFSPAGSSTVEAVSRFIKKLVFQNTIVLETNPDDAVDRERSRQYFEEKLASGQAWEYTFEGQHFGGCCGEGARNETVTLEQALDQISFTVVVAGNQPQGFTLQEVRLLGYDPYDVFTVYDGPAGRFGLYQSKVGVQSIENISEKEVVVALSKARGSGVVTDGSIEEIQIGSITGALVDNEQIIWEKDSITYILIGPGLERETLIQIAGSLIPDTWRHN